VRIVVLHLCRNVNVNVLHLCHSRNVNVLLVRGYMVNLQSFTTERKREV
jgi:hypothetical protein